MSSRILRKNKEHKTISSLIRAIEHQRESNSYLPNSFNPEKINERFLSLSSKEDIASPIFSYITGIKDLISNTDGLVTGGSKFLSDYLPPYNATVYSSLKNSGAVNVLNTNLDEFGLGGTGLHGLNGFVKNPHDADRITGGSSSGSGFLIGNNLLDFSVVTDTGDSARQPASYCGIVGFKPSFGAISRYGFYPFCSGFDTPSIMASSVEIAARVFSCISFSDSKDLCTLHTKKIDFSSIFKSNSLKGIRIAVLKNTFWTYERNSSKDFLDIQEKFESFLFVLKEKFGVQVFEYEFPQEILKLAELVYLIVSSVESISNYSNMTGMLFPFKQNKDKLEILKLNNGQNYEEILFKNRSDFGNEFVFRQLLGRHFIEGVNYDEIYLKSKKLLTIFNEEIKKVFKFCDLIISPTSDKIPPKIKGFQRNYSPSNIKNILLLANFCSIPAISIPWETVNNLPVGLHLMSYYRNDEFLLNIANSISLIINK